MMFSILFKIVDLLIGLDSAISLEISYNFSVGIDSQYPFIARLVNKHTHAILLFPLINGCCFIIL